MESRGGCDLLLNAVVPDRSADRSAVSTIARADDDVWAGAALYTRRNLRLYDLGLAFNCRVFWRCPRRRLVDLYDRHVSGRHLDVGVATGWLLDSCRFPVADPEITLMDLNPDALAVAAGRVARYGPSVRRADALEPSGLPAGSFGMARCVDWSGT